MLYFRILVQVLALGSALLIAVLDYYWRDKRTIHFKRGRQLLLLLAVASLVASVTLTVIDSRHVRAESEALHTALAAARSEAMRAAGETIAARSELADGLRHLSLQNDDLVRSLQPFLAVARKRYPGATDNEAVAALGRDLQALTSRTTHLEQAAAPRALRQPSEGAFSAATADLRGVPIDFQAVAGNAEAFTLARQLVAHLRAHRVDARLTGTLVHPKPLVGVAVCGPAHANQQDVADLELSLTLLGLTTHRADPALCSPGLLRVLIGVKGQPLP